MNGVQGAGAARPAVETGQVGGIPVPGDTTGGQFGAFFQSMMETNTEMLMRQEQIQGESRRYQMLSNVSKSKHDAEMNSIRNFKA